MAYFCVYYTDNGTIQFAQLEEDELIKRLNCTYWGQDVNILKDAVNDLCNESERCLLIIEGKVVVPKAIPQFVRWTFDESS